MDKKKNGKRKRIYVDPEVQLALGRRLLMHWFLFVVVCFGVVGFLQACVEHPSTSLSGMFISSLRRNVLSLFAGFAMIPLFIYDMMQTTNRFAGPITRLRSMLREIGKDGVPRELHMRNGDYWCELADEFNLAVTKLQERPELTAYSEPEARSAM